MAGSLHAAAAAALLFALGGPAAAQDRGPQDHEAGVPLAPAEAAGAWTVSAEGRDLCVVTLETRRTSTGVYGASSAPECAGVLPAPAAGWKPTADGMALIGRNGQPLLAFGRWSNSLFVSHRDSGTDLQLRRGKPAG